MERLKKRGILKDNELKQIEKRNEPTKKASGEVITSAPNQSLVTESQASSGVSSGLTSSETSKADESKKRPLERDRKSVV